MKRFISAFLLSALLLTVFGCGSSQMQTNETTANTAQTESVSAVTTEPMESETVTTEVVPVTEPPAETEAAQPPGGYGSEVAAFDSIRAMIDEINSGELSALEQRIFDTYGCETKQLRELTGLDAGFSESTVEWCGGYNYCINYAKDGQVISFIPYYTDEQLNDALSSIETWDVLQKNELLLNLEKTDIPTNEGFMYECTFDTSRVTGQRKTYHEFTGTDGIQRIVTGWYGADGNPISGRIYVFDGQLPFSCYVMGFDADMALAKQLGTRLIQGNDTAAEQPTAAIELHSQNADLDFGFSVKLRDGAFVRASGLALDVTMTNQMDTAYTWTGSSDSFQPWMKFVCVTEDGEYVIQPQSIPMSADVGNHKVEPGEHQVHTLTFQIPGDAPAGDYTLICSFQKTKHQFEGVFRLREPDADTVNSTVVYSENEATNEISTSVGYENHSVYHWQSDWFYGDAGYRVIRGSAAARMEQLLTVCKTTGGTSPKQSDITVQRLDEIEGRLPCERGTVWLEVGGNIYRRMPSEKAFALVDGYFGAGEYLEMDEQSQAELFDILEYWPRDYYSGTYKNGTLTVRHVFRGESSVSAVVTGFQIDKKDGQNNVITLALTAEQDAVLDLYVTAELSSDNLLDIYSVPITLAAGETLTKELSFVGHADERYFVYITIGNTVIDLWIEP